MSEPARYDAIVAGAGMAGLTAASVLAAGGAHVLVLEKAADIGGSSGLSGGTMWVPDDPEQLIRECPHADPHLIRTLCADYPRLIELIRSRGMDPGPEGRVLGYGHGHVVDPNAYLERCRAVVVDAGGTVLTRSQLFALTSEGGAVIGAAALSAGEELSWRAGATILTGGGFQADPELTAAYIHPNAPGMLLRSNRASTGDSLRAALEVGAALSPSMTGFYGHLVSWPVDNWVPGIFTRISQYHSDHAALVNVNGDVFRPPFDSDHYNAQWAVRQPEGRAVMIMDATLHANQASPSSLAVPVDRFAAGVEHGGNHAIASTIAELGQAISAWGFAGDRLEDAIAGFNTHCSGPQQPVVAPPFYALEVRAAITFTHGGLRIDDGAHVLDRDAHQVPGLYAAGADAGGVFDGGYGGGLSAAGVFGMRAADSILATLR